MGLSLHLSQQKPQADQKYRNAGNRPHSARVPHTNEQTSHAQRRRVQRAEMSRRPINERPLDKQLRPRSASRHTTPRKSNPSATSRGFALRPGAISREIARLLPFVVCQPSGHCVSGPSRVSKTQHRVLSNVVAMQHSASTIGAVASCWTKHDCRASPVAIVPGR